MFDYLCRALSKRLEQMGRRFKEGDIQKNFLTSKKTVQQAAVEINEFPIIGLSFWILSEADD